MKARSMVFRISESMFRAVKFENLEAGSKKAVRVSVRLNLTSDDVIFTDRIKSRAEVVGFENPETGLFVTQLQTPEDTDDISSTYHQFRMAAVAYANQTIAQKLEALGNKSIEEYEKLGYKPLSRIRSDIEEYMSDLNEFYADLQKQVNNVVSRRLPRVNEFMLYADDDIQDFKTTGRVPYNNPMKAELTIEQRNIVENFLDVFLDDYNKKVISWYFGAALSNVQLHDDRVSKMLVVASKSSGSGKSSLITGLSNALMTSLFHWVTPSMDRFFMSSSRFASGTLPTTRLSIYSEADFADSSITDKHDFTGLATSTIKSLITDGYIADEKKYQNEIIKKLHGLHVVLTNHPPVITENTEALRRRFLALAVKPTRMQDKAKELDLWGQNKFNQFLIDNAQAFANYFVSVFNEDQYMFTDTDYDHYEFVDEIETESREMEQAEVQAKIEEQTQENEPDVLKNEENPFGSDLIHFIQKKGVDEHAQTQKLVTLINKAFTGDESSGIVRVADNNIYIDSTKGTILELGHNVLTVRAALIDRYGSPVKKFGKRMIKIPLERHVTQYLQGGVNHVN